jgi:heterodisulfide reductase subunit B
MIVLSYYPGCSLKTSSSFFEKSITKVLPRFGIGLEELEDWSCCGATAARAVDETLADALVARNLALAEKKARHFFAPCSACYNRAVVTNEKIRIDGKRRAEINDMIKPGRCLGTLKITNIIELFRDYVGVEQIAAKAAFDLGDLRVVPYYGCVLTRIPKTETFDDREYPQAMDRILSAAGAKVLDWPYRTECCGASRTVIDKKITLRLSSLIVDRAFSEGAHAVVTSCPLCQMNLDLLPHLGGTVSRLPVLFLTEILELALFGTLTGRRAHMINADAVTEKVRRKEKAGGGLA